LIKAYTLNRIPREENPDIHNGDPDHFIIASGKADQTTAAMKVGEESPGSIEQDAG